MKTCTMVTSALLQNDLSEQSHCKGKMPMASGIHMGGGCVTWNWGCSWPLRHCSLTEKEIGESSSMYCRGGRAQVWSQGLSDREVTQCWPWDPSLNVEFIYYDVGSLKVVSYSLFNNFVHKLAFLGVALSTWGSISGFLNLHISERFLCRFLGKGA